MRSITIPQRFVPILDLNQGTSDQHPQVQRQGQSQTLVNFRIDAAHGIGVRNGSDFIKQLPPDTNKSWRIDTFQNRWTIWITTDEVRAFDEDGTEITVDNDVGNYNYLNQATDRHDLRTTEEFNSIIILNRKVNTEFNTSADYQVDGEVETWQALFEEPDSDEAEDPTLAPIGARYHVLQDWQQFRAGYYEKVNLSTGETSWEIISPPNQANAVPNPDTMPHQLIFDEDNNKFIWQQPNWRPRFSGTAATNESPPWVGQSIEEIIFHNGRLFYLGASHIISSDEAVDLKSVFNVFNWSVDVKSRTDRIWSSINATQVGEFLYAAEMGGQLMIAAEHGIIQFGAGQRALTATNGSNFKVDSIEVDEFARIGRSGTEAFVADLNKRVYWYSVNNGSIVSLGEITAHRPDLLQQKTLNDLYIVDNTLYMLTDSTVETHEKISSQGQTRRLAWSQLEFAEPIKFVYRFGNKTKLITKSHKLLDYEHRQIVFDDSVSDDSVSAEKHMDLRHEPSSSTYVPSTDRTRFVLDYNADDDTWVWVITDNDGNQVNQSFKPVFVQNNLVEISGRYDSSDVRAGQFFAAENIPTLPVGNQNQRLVVQGMFLTLKYATSGTIFQRWKSFPVDESIERFDFSRTSQSQIGDLQSTEDAQYQAFIMGDAQEITVGVRTDNPDDSFFLVGYGWNLDVNRN